MTKFTILMCAFLTTSLVHAEEKLIPKFSQKVSIGDGSVVYLDPRVVYENESYFIQIDSMDWSQWGPDGYCKLLNGPNSKSNWWIDFVDVRRGNVPVIGLDADGTFRAVYRPANSNVLTGITCFNAEKPNAKSPYVFEIREIEGGLAEIGSESYIDFPFTVKFKSYFGAHSIGERSKRERIYLLVNEHTAQSVCEAAGYAEAISIETSLKEYESKIVAAMFGSKFITSLIGELPVFKSKVTCAK